MRALCVGLAIGGCATVKKPELWNIDHEVGAFVAPTQARFAVTPERVEHDPNVLARRAPAAEAPSLGEARASVVGGVARVGVSFADWLVAGLEFEGGAASSSIASSDASTSSAIHLGMAGVVGAITQLGRVSLGAELVSGYRKLEKHTDDGEWFYVEGHPFVEPRLRAHVWLTSWLALGGYVAFDRDSSTGGGVRLVGRLPESVYAHRRSR